MRHVRLRLPFGQDLLLVPSHAVRRIDRAQAEQFVRALLDSSDGRERVRELARLSAAEAVDDDRIVDIVAGMLAAGDLAVVELDDPNPTWRPPRAAPSTRLAELADPLPTRRPAALEPDDQPALLRVELGSMGFAPLGVLTLPRGDARHPWAALVTAAMFLREHRGAGLVLVGHREPEEPAEYSRLRAQALLHFIGGDRTAWVAIAAKWGRVSDAQQFLGYLGRDERWPIDPLEPTDTADDPTARAVLAFQCAYNAKRESGPELFEDGVIGEQTLGAIYDVARASFGRWLAVNGISDDPWAFHDPSHRMLDCGDRFKPYRTLPPLPRQHGGRFVDLVIVPAEETAKVTLGRAPAGAGVYDVASVGSLPIRGVAPPETALALEIVLRDEADQPMNGTRFEVVDSAGTLHAGMLDEFGEARVNGLPAGQCRVRFPELAPGRWFLEGSRSL